MITKKLTNTKGLLKMKTNNYYDTLSKVQKQKWAEKQGNLCYYEWFDTFYEEYTLEETGAILLSLMFYDRTGGTQPLPKDLETIIDRDRATRTLFTTYMEKTAAATREWINRHKLKDTEESDKENTKQPPDMVLKTVSIVKKTYSLYPDNDTFTVIYTPKNQRNIPSNEDLQRVFEETETDIAIIDELVYRGNNDDWEKPYQEYVNEILLDIKGE